MAINVNAAATSTLAAAVEAKASSVLPHPHRHSNVAFPLSSNPQLRLLSTGSSGISCNVMAKAQLNKVSVDSSAAGASTPGTESKAPADESKNKKLDNGSSPLALASEESVSEFISQVSNLIKLVDSKDIVELQMKQLDCEVIIRKKEAIAPTLAPAPLNFMQPPPLQSVSQVAAPTHTPAPVAPSQAPASSAPKPAKSSVPPLKSPMAGTFYCSPAPGAPPFVKVGDKVQKGQVVCIVEAMKSMNEIEADQSGTLTEILAEDTKPVSFDTPLFVIQP